MTIPPVKPAGVPFLAPYAILPPMASSSPASPPADPLALLASLYAPPLLVRLTALPAAAGWRLELSEDDGGTWTSFEGGKPGKATPAEAIEVGAQFLSGWIQARTQAYDAEIAHFFRSGKLERRKIQIDNENELQDGYAAKAEDGTWIEYISPIEAIDKAKAKGGHSK